MQIELLTGVDLGGLADCCLHFQSIFIAKKTLLWPPLVSIKHRFAPPLAIAPRFKFMTTPLVSVSFFINVYTMYFVEAFIICQIILTFYKYCADCCLM